MQLVARLKLPGGFQHLAGGRLRHAEAACQRRQRADAFQMSRQRAEALFFFTQPLPHRLRQTILPLLKLLLRTVDITLRLLGRQALRQTILLARGLTQTQL